MEEKTIENMLKLLKLDDLEGDFKIMAQNTGLTPVKMLLKHWDGLPIAVPKITKISKLVQRYIKEILDKNPRIKIAEIAKTLNISYRTASKYLNKIRKENEILVKKYKKKVA